MRLILFLSLSLALHRVIPLCETSKETETTIDSSFGRITRNESLFSNEIQRDAFAIFRKSLTKRYP